MHYHSFSDGPSSRIEVEKLLGLLVHECDANSDVLKDVFRPTDGEPENRNKHRTRADDDIQGEHRKTGGLRH